ncbi:MAG TPA: hypothetical protein PLH76_07745, partial [Rectinema sp.]|nr:hypothetical protein [Rectinema sp.]
MAYDIVEPLKRVDAQTRAAATTDPSIAEFVKSFYFQPISYTISGSIGYIGLCIRVKGMDSN